MKSIKQLLEAEAQALLDLKAIKSAIYHAKCVIFEKEQELGAWEIRWIEARQERATALDAAKSLSPRGYEE